MNERQSERQVGWILGGSVLCDQCCERYSKLYTTLRSVALYDANILPYTQRCFVCFVVLVAGRVSTELFDQPITLDLDPQEF